MYILTEVLSSSMGAYAANVCMVMQDYRAFMNPVGD